MERKCFTSLSILPEKANARNNNPPPAIPDTNSKGFELGGQIVELASRRPTMVQESAGFFTEHYDSGHNIKFEFLVNKVSIKNDKFFSLSSVAKCQLLPIPYHP